MHFRKHLGCCLLRQLLSEILCLVLSFSFALLGHAKPLQLLQTVCCLTAQILLTADGAATISADSRRTERLTGKTFPAVRPLLLSLAAVLPAYLLYLLLLIFRSSVLMQNLFLLLNAPFIGIYRLLFNGAEPFSAVSKTAQLLTALPPLLTAVSFLAGYYLRQHTSGNPRV
ncbi:MAG: hypothetical protein K5705_14750 [Oscillospiraceae bacterium]|nr:hypothetical protein [Oscillospiraceae bacterium]